MGLSINAQTVFVSQIEKIQNPETKKWYLKAKASFMSSTKNQEEEYERDDPFFANLVCFSEEANKVIGALAPAENLEGKGLVDISGKIYSRSYETKQGKKRTSTELVVFTAKPFEKKVKKQTNIVEDTNAADTTVVVSEPPF